MNQEIHKLAIISLVLSVISFFVLKLILAPIALFLSIKDYYKQKKEFGKATTLSIVALIVTSVMCTLLALTILGWLSIPFLMLFL